MACNCVTKGTSCQCRTDKEYWDPPVFPTIIGPVEWGYHVDEPKKIKKKHRQNIRGRNVESVVPHRVG